MEKFNHANILSPPFKSISILSYFPKLSQLCIISLNHYNYYFNKFRLITGAVLESRQINLQSYQKECRSIQIKLQAIL